MKRKILIAFLLVMTITSYSQNSNLSINGGYAFSKIENSDIQATGWRINAVYEFNPAGSRFSHGAAIGFISISATEAVLQENVTATINSLPIYYAPKFIFGKEKIKGFIKAAAGLQFAFLRREGVKTFNDDDLGFYGGGGGGLTYDINEKLFIRAEYEIAYASNNSYKDNWINSAMGGIGIRF